MGVSLAKRETVRSYEYLRVWLTLLVLLGHSGSLAITSMDFTVNINPYSESGVYVRTFMTFVINVIYSFHMPAFMMLSGSIFALTFCYSKRVRWRQKRVVRLLIPFFGVAFFFLLPVRILVGYYGSSIDYVHIIFNDILLAKDINYLWYLLALFEISMVMSVFSKIVLTTYCKVQIAIFLFLGSISTAQFVLPQCPFALNDFLRYLFWFYVGILFEKYRTILKRISNQYHFLFLGGIWLMCFILHGMMERQGLSNAALENVLIYKIIKMAIRYCVELSASLLLFGIALKVGDKTLSKFAEYINRNSFPIYLYHAPIMMLTRKVIHLTIPSQMMTEALYAVALLCVIVAGLFGSVGVNCLVSKIREMIKRC